MGRLGMPPFHYHGTGGRFVNWRGVTANPGGVRLRNYTHSLLEGDMAEKVLYIWVTWLAKLLAGDADCEWAAWFKAQQAGSGWSRAASGEFDRARWVLDHTALLRECREQWREKGCEVFVERQNRFKLQGKAATLAGQPDLVAVGEDAATVIDVKTGQRRDSHVAQVMVYMYAAPQALGHCWGLPVRGQVVYPDGVVDVPASAVDDRFFEELRALILRLASEVPPRRAPSPSECRFCDITRQDCPDRMAGG